MEVLYFLKYSYKLILDGVLTEATSYNFFDFFFLLIVLSTCCCLQ